MPNSGYFISSVLVVGCTVDRVRLHLPAGAKGSAEERKNK